MKVLLSWLQEYVDIKISAHELADLLTNIGLEVEGIEYIGDNLKNIIVGEVTDIFKDENSDNLYICKINTGTGIKSIVTAASNVYKGAKVPAALPGSILPNGKTITETTIKGLKSEGMLCSKLELELADYATGILILPAEINTGVSLNTVINEVVIDISITPNRADCLSIKGVAREIAAATNQKMKIKNFNLNEIEETAEDNIRIEINDFEKCSRYVGKFIKNIKIKPSPFEMQLRLELCGVRAINNIVDVTNYALLELGHPLHAFDYDTLKGKKIIVRCAEKGEKITAIDDIERNLNKNNLVIADAEIPVAIAGVMGGKYTEVTDKTNNILLESAYFSPESIRKTSKELKLSSEASYRFERGTDIDKLEYAANYAAYLIAETSGGEICKGTVDTNNGFDKWTEVSLNIDKVKKILGIEIPKHDIIKYLELLEFNVTDKDSKLSVKIPTHRNDIYREIDLIEEVARIYGFDKIEAHNPICDLTYGWRSDYDYLVDNFKKSLVYKGFKEAITYSFTSIDEIKLLDKNNLLLFNEAGEYLNINNPISIDSSVMRPTLLFSLLNVLKLNSNIKNLGFSFFESGKVFGQINRNDKFCSDFADPDIIKHTVSNELPFEKEFLGLLISDPLTETNWLKNTSSSSFFLMKSYIENLLSENNINNFKFIKNDFVQFQKGQSAAILFNNKLIGVIGKVNPDISNYFDVNNNTFFAELNLDEIIKNYDSSPAMFKSFSKYPAVSRDIAVVLKDSISYNDIKSEINSLNIDLLENFEIIDVYKGKPIKEGYKNIALSFNYRSKEKTLGENDINEIHQQIFEMLVNKFNAETR